MAKLPRYFCTEHPPQGWDGRIYLGTVFEEIDDPDAKAYFWSRLSCSKKGRRIVGLVDSPKPNLPASEGGRLYWLADDPYIAIPLRRYFDGRWTLARDS